MNKKDSEKLTDHEKAMVKKIQILTQAVEKVYPTTKFLMWRSFVQGVFVALGTTVGLSIVLGVLTYIITTLKLVPGINQIIDKTQIENAIPNKVEIDTKD